MSYQRAILGCKACYYAEQQRARHIALSHASATAETLATIWLIERNLSRFNAIAGLEEVANRASLKEARVEALGIIYNCSRCKFEKELIVEKVGESRFPSLEKMERKWEESH